MYDTSILQQHVTILNIYAPNNRGQNTRGQKLTELKGETYESTIIYGDINSQPSKRDRSANNL